MTREQLIGITKNKIEYIKKQPRIDTVYLEYYENILALLENASSLFNETMAEKEVLIKSYQKAFDKIADIISEVNSYE